MTIIKHDPSEGRWTAVPRSLIQKNELSVEARFLVVWLLSHAENWQIRPEFCEQKLGFSREKWAKITTELIAAGYWSRVTRREKNGQLKTETHVRAEPIPPGAGLPTAGEPTAGEPGVGNPAPIEETNKKKVEKENNNTCTQVQVQPTTKNEEVVVAFDPDFQIRNLLSIIEQKNITATLATIAGTRRQAAADELSGALRARGRQSPRGIKNPVIFLRSILQVDPSSWTYSLSEKELREARARSVHLCSPGPHPASEEKGPYGPPSPEIRAKIDQILGRNPTKTGV
jgi:hypothetical protein